MPLDATEDIQSTFEVHLEMTDTDDTSESTTMIDVIAWVTCKGKKVAKCQGNLIKREMMRDPAIFPYLMEVTQELEELAKEYGIFRPDLNGTMTENVMVEYVEKQGLFHENDYKIYRQMREAKEHHPCNCAWILYFNTLTVD